MLVLIPTITVADEVPKTDYKYALKKIENIIKNFSNEDFYKNHTFIHKKTGEHKKIEDFSDLKKNVLFLITIRKLTGFMEKLQNIWNKELESVDPKVEDPKLANKSDIEGFIKELFELRKRAAEKYETFAEELFNNFPDDFSKEEKNFIMDDIRDYNDKHKLIERKK